MQLNGWQKLGVALSIAWAVAAGINTHNDDVERADNFAKLAYKTCSNTKMLAKDSDLSSCEKEKAANIETWMKDSGKNAAFAALAPIPFGWLAGFILLYAARNSGGRISCHCAMVRVDASQKRICHLLRCILGGGTAVRVHGRHESVCGHAGACRLVAFLGRDQNWRRHGPGQRDVDAAWSDRGIGHGVSAANLHDRLLPIRKPMRRGPCFGGWQRPDIRGSAAWRAELDQRGHRDQRYPPLRGGGLHDRPEHQERQRCGSSHQQRNAVLQAFAGIQGGNRMDLPDGKWLPGLLGRQEQRPAMAPANHPVPVWPLTGRRF